MRVRIVMTLVVGILIAVSSLVHAQSPGGYDLTWHTIDNGGVSFSTSGGYQLGSTIGQPDAGVLSGGNYTLVGGFWQDGVSSEPLPHHIYLPFVLR